MKILIRTGKCEAIIERGACFFPTIGTTTLTDLPLATPKIDHDSLRDILSPFSTTVRDRGFSPPPTGNWQPIVLYSKKEGLHKYFLSHSSLIY
jgi:hypothetical protein